MSGTIALVAFTVFLIAVLALFAIGARAASRRPTLNNLHPENAPRYVLSGFITFGIVFASGVTGLVAGIVWILEKLMAHT
jgi:uncharacterized membrane protein YfcA